MRHEIPSPPDGGLVNAVRFGTDTFRFLDAVQSRYEDAVRVPLPGRGPLVVVTNPELADDVLSRPEEFPRPPAQDSAAMIAERGLVQSEGDLWRQQRRIVVPSFTGQRVAAYANAAGERVAATAEEWADAAGDPRDLHREMTSLTVRVASEVLLGEDIGRERAEQFNEWMRVAADEFEFSPSTVGPDWLPSPVSGEFHDAADGIRGLAEELVERRRAQLPDDDADDMLALLIAAEDDPDVDFPPDQIRDEVVTFLIAGHETTALSLTFAWSLLSWHPSVRERVREEARAVMGEERPCHEHVADLAYTRRAFREALRLYPAAWAVFRRTNTDVRLGDYRVPGDAAVVCPQWSIHRDDRYFEHPERFDPDRWLDRSPAETPAYFPFGSGPHACIGRQFSLAGATLTLAGLSRDFDVEVPEDALDDLAATVTLRPPDGVPATIRRAE